VCALYYRKCLQVSDVRNLVIMTCILINVLDTSWRWDLRVLDISPRPGEMSCDLWIYGLLERWKGRMLLLRVVCIRCMVGAVRGRWYLKVSWSELGYGLGSALIDAETCGRIMFKSLS
jgi:hypothetical protein